MMYSMCVPQGLKFKLGKASVTFLCDGFHVHSLVTPNQKYPTSSTPTPIFNKNQHNLRNKAFFVKKQNKNQKRLYFFVKNHFSS